MIRLNEEPRRLTSTFLNYRNDVDIYTEDNDKDKEFYKVLFRRLLTNDILINDVTPLGSRNAVIKRCQEEPENGRKKIFIIDGDVTIIHGRNIPSLRNLYVLDAYCIENFLIDKETIIQFIYLSCATKAKETIEIELAFDEWLKEYCINFIELFLHFALANYFEVKFTLFNANKYHTKVDNEYIFSADLVCNDILNIKTEILNKVSETEFNTKLNELRSQWNININNLLTIVSGKDYLIPILLLKASSFKKSKSFPSLEEIKFSLVQFSSLEKLAKLKKTIEQL